MIDRNRLLTITLSLVLAGCAGAPEKEPSSSATDTVQSAGVARYEAGEYKLALDQFRRALHGHRVLFNREGITTSAINIARTYHAMGELETARRWVTKADAFNGEVAPDNYVQLNENLTLLMADIEIDSGNLTQAESVLKRVEASKDAGVRLYAQKLTTEIAFLNGNDPAAALAAYETAVNASSDASRSHRARLARFKAALLDEPATQIALYEEAEKIYLDLGKHSAIATTLSEAAQTNIVIGDLALAEKKILRALYIRASTADRRKSLSSLEDLKGMYPEWPFEGEIPPAGRDAKLDYWIEKLGDTGFDDWTGLLRDFDTFPR